MTVTFENKIVPGANSPVGTVANGIAAMLGVVLASGSDGSEIVA